MILCFDIGGTAIKVAEVTGPQGPGMPYRLPTPTHDFAAFVAAMRKAVAAASQPPRILAISIAGAVDKAGLATVANIPCLTGRPLAQDLQAALGLPVVLANDADCFAMAEAVQGAGRGHDVVLGIILGTGVGGGVVAGGRLIAAAGEWGHGPVLAHRADVPVLRCGCGQTGCLDTLGGARGMEHLHRHLHGAGADSRAIVSGWQAGDPASAATVRLWCDVLAGPLAMVANLLTPGVIAAGGGLASSAPLVAMLDGAVRQRILRRMDGPLVVPATAGEEPGLIGAAALACAA
ncbi:ROK family protein [Falsirhodobacter deserti]|uniref:ROK family protein n=1 Tax=Falsirhodobacter deserti TaxID=1365611 RepID=UPI000FE309E7|nr:ROK family protein [Falsirhodobacter deserti]